MSEFKVGDSVRLKEGLEIGEEYGNDIYVEEMFFEGSKIIIESHPFGVKIEGFPKYVFTPEMLKSDRLTILEIIDRNYKATVKRGKITPETTILNFLEKIKEELGELAESHLRKALSHKFNEFDSKELADITLVCFAMAKHYGIDLLKVMEEKTIFNETRED